MHFVITKFSLFHFLGSADPGLVITPLATRSVTTGHSHIGN